MAPLKARPSFVDCLKLSAALVRNTAGLAGQYVTIAAVETTVAAGRQFGRAVAGIETVRWAVVSKFDYTAPKPKAPKPAKSASETKVHPIKKASADPVPTNSYVKV